MEEQMSRKDLEGLELVSGDDVEIAVRSKLHRLAKGIASAHGVNVTAMLDRIEVEGVQRRGVQLSYDESMFVIDVLSSLLGMD